jgi:predicted phage terminase large subunit-like protein
LYNRVNDPVRACRVMVMQKLRVGDLADHVMQQNQGWIRIVIPSEFNPELAAKYQPTPIGWSDPRTEPGQLLDPRRFPLDFLASERARLGTAGYNAQHGQNPDAEGGGWFHRDWWSFFRIEGEPSGGHTRPEGCSKREAYTVPCDRDGIAVFEWMFVSVDATFKKTETGSNVGLLVVGGIAERRFVLDDKTRRMSFTETCDAILAMIQKFGARRVLIEAKANGEAIMDTMRKQVMEGEIRDANGKPIVIIFDDFKTTDSKEARAQAIIPQVEAGLVYLLDGAPWLDAFIGEHASFPNGNRDDRVDALDQALIHKAKRVTWADAFKKRRVA